MITDYIVLRESDTIALAQRVCTFLERGWKPQGGVAIAQVMGLNLHTTYAQAMIIERK